MNENLPPTQAFRRALLSTAMLNAAGAILNSIALGTPLGALGFAAIAATGFYARYRHFRGASLPQNPLMTVVTTPSLTMTALGGISLVTLAQQAYQIVTAPTPCSLAESARASGWGFGALGDVAQRETDHTNFSRDRKESSRSKLMWLTRCGAGPYYNAVSFCFTMSLGLGATTPEAKTLTGLATSLFGFGAAASFAPPHSTLNKLGYSAGAVGALLLGGLAFTQGKGLVTIAQICFALSYATSFYEFRQAHLRRRSQRSTPAA